MVRNLPPRYVQDRFIALLGSYGFDGTYDFVYVPHAASNKNKNKGYAFVNFLNAEYAKRLREVWDLQCIFHAEQSTRSLTRSVRIPRRSLKGVSVGYAAIQGVEANLANLRVRQGKGNTPAFYCAVQPARTTTSSTNQKGNPRDEKLRIPASTTTSSTNQKGNPRDEKHRIPACTTTLSTNQEGKRYWRIKGNPRDEKHWIPARTTTSSTNQEGKQYNQKGNLRDDKHQMRFSRDTNRSYTETRAPNTAWPSYLMAYEFSVRGKEVAFLVPCDLPCNFPCNFPLQNKVVNDPGWRDVGHFINSAHF